MVNQYFDDICKLNNYEKFDFMNMSSLAYISPTMVIIHNEEIHRVSSWKDVYICFFRYVYNNFLKSSTHLNITSLNNTPIVDCGNCQASLRMKKPVQIDEDFFVETNIQPAEIINRIKALLELCVWDYSDLSVYYRTLKHENYITNDDPDNCEHLTNTADYLVFNKQYYDNADTNDSEESSPDEYIDKEIDFYNIHSVAHTKPTKVFIQEDEYLVSSWADAYVCIFEYMYANFSEKIPLKASLIKTGHKIDLGSTEDSLKMRRPRQIATDRYIETNISANGIVRRITILLDLCNFDYDKLSIYYCFNGIRNPSANELLNDKSDDKEDYIDFDKESYTRVLMSRYQGGMQLDSIDLENFRETYKDIIGKEITFDDPLLEKCLIQCGVLYQNRIFPADGIVSSDVKEKLLGYISNSFGRGKAFLYYKSIYTDLHDDFIYCFNLADEYMLKAYLIYELKDQQYYFYDDYMANTKSVELNHIEEVEQFFLNAGKPLSYDEVYSGLSHISSNVIYQEIKSSKKLVLNEKKHYYHIDIFEISSSEAEKIISMIKEDISNEGYCIWSNIFNKIKEEMPLFIEHNAYLSSIGIRNALDKKISTEFNFDGQVICSKNQSLNMSMVYRLFGLHHAPFSDSDLHEFAKEVSDGVIYFNALYESCVRVSRNLFVPKNKIVFNVKEIDKALSTYIVNGYMLFNEIDSFLLFPNVEYEWNSFLLESYLLNYSNDFILLNNGTSMNNISGAVVKKGCGFEDFVDICSDYLAKNDIKLEENEVLDYLVQKGLLTRRKYGDINRVIEKAKRLRNNKG